MPLAYSGNRMPPMFVTPRPIVRRRGFWAALWHGLISFIGGSFVILWDIVRAYPLPRVERRWVRGHLAFTTVMVILTTTAFWLDGFAVYRATQTMTHYLKLQIEVKPTPYDELIKLYAARHNLDPGLVAAVIKQESDFDPEAVSSAGACGLMQLMPQTWRGLVPDSSCAGNHEPPALEPDCIFNPEANIRAGTLLLSGLVDRYGNNLVLVLAAYNSGSNLVTEAAQPADLGRFPNYPETRTFIRGVLSSWTRFSDNPLGVLTLRFVIWCRQALYWFGGLTVFLWLLTAVWLARRYEDRSYR